MNLKNSILFSLSVNTLKRNKKFENIHKGESCYIFGNGSSLKYFDLAKFDDKCAIVCGALFLHRDFRKINIGYYYEGEPFFYYHYWVNPYSRRVSRNPMGSFYKGKVLLNDDVPFFCSISNYFGIRGDHIYYVHHFGKAFDGFSNCRLDGNFTAMAGSLSGMLGLAIYMGFEDITLVGCDYTFYPRAVRHFYEIGMPVDKFDDFVPNQEVLSDAQKYAAIRTVVPHDNYKGRMLPYISYQELTGDKPEYRENNEILSYSNLLELDRTGMRYVIFP